MREAPVYLYLIENAIQLILQTNQVQTIRSMMQSNNLNEYLLGERLAANKIQPEEIHLVANNQNQTGILKDGQEFHINLLDLGLYRIKNHCNYDMQAAATPDYSIFQVEILSEELRNHYKGAYLLEVWSKDGDRILHKVLQSEVSKWKVYDNVLIFKTAFDSPLIHVCFLKEKTITAVQHPYETEEVDMIYYDQLLIVVQQNSVRYMQITPKDAVTSIKSQNSGSQEGQNQEHHMPLLQREFTGMIYHNIVGFVHNYLRDELICVTNDNQHVLTYIRVRVKREDNNHDGFQQIDIKFSDYEPTHFDTKNRRSIKFDLKKGPRVEPAHSNSKVIQLHYLSHEGTPYVVILRENTMIEIVRNFTETVLYESRVSACKILPGFGLQLQFLHTDGSVIYSPAFSTFNINTERHTMTIDQYYKLQTLPPHGSTQHDIHRRIQFFQDFLVVNQSLFLLRDNAIFLVDTFTARVIETFFPQQGYAGTKVMKLHRLRDSKDDENGFKVSTFKVVAVQRNGTIQMFEPRDLNLQNEWKRTEINNTPMAHQHRENSPVQKSFQNNAAINYLYIVTVNNQNQTKKLFQMMFNGQFIELNLKLAKSDMVFSVNFTTRSREMIGVIDQKYLIIYWNDKGVLKEHLKINQTRFELRDNLSSESLCYYNKDFVTFIGRESVYKISVASTTMQESRLRGPLQSGGGLFIDAQCFYFLVAPKFVDKTEQHGETLLTCAEITMIDASFQDQSQIDGPAAIQEANTRQALPELMHPTYRVAGDSAIHKMDYDEFNTLISLQTSNFEIVQVPLVHRNSVQFVGMAERSYYLCYRKIGNRFLALDKSGYLNEWSLSSGQMIYRKLQKNMDLDRFEMVREVYDKNWFNYSLVYREYQKPINTSLQRYSMANRLTFRDGGDAASDQDVLYREYRVLKINKLGQLVEKKSFVHAYALEEDQYLYFSHGYKQMIELNLLKQVKQLGGEVKLSQRRGNYFQHVWDEQERAYILEKHLNAPEQEQIDETGLIQSQKSQVAGEKPEPFFEWHKRESLYPFTLNLKDLTQFKMKDMKLNPSKDTFKVINEGAFVEILNTKDGFQLIRDTVHGDVVSYMTLQYSFKQTQESFFDRRTGQFQTLEVIARLQNFYEYLRSQMYLRQNLYKSLQKKEPLSLELRDIDVSSRGYKNKYISEQSYTQLDLMFLKQFFLPSEDMLKQEDFKYEDIQKVFLKNFKRMAPIPVQRLLYNIFPRDDQLFFSEKVYQEKGQTAGEANTVLHFLAKYSTLGFECIDFIAKMSKKDSIVVPFMPNTSMKTPLHITVQLGDQKQTNSLIKLIQHAPMDNHSRLIGDLFPKLIGEMNIPKLEKYFDRRMFQVGLCKTTNVLRLNIPENYDMKAVSSSVVGETIETLERAMTDPKKPEQQVKLQVFDFPLNCGEGIFDLNHVDIAQVVAQIDEPKNQYEISIVKSLATTEEEHIFQNNTIRAFLDFLWPIAKSRIIWNIFLPYLAFTLYFLLYITVVKRLEAIKLQDPEFYQFTMEMFGVYDIFFKFILFIGCAYFIMQDLQQMNSLSNNQIVLWSYANVIPLAIMMFVATWDIFFKSNSSANDRSALQKTLYSTTAFLVWTRVIHLLKIFTHTSYLLRLATEILFRIRWLIAFIVISLLSFGFVFYYVDDSMNTQPIDGVKQIFDVLVGQYDVSAFANTYQTILLVLVASFNGFFIFTILVQLSVASFTKSDGSTAGGVWSNEAYLDKASLMGLYSYLIAETPIRRNFNQYLTIATKIDHHKKGLAKKAALGESQLAGDSNDPRAMQVKSMKTIERRIAQLQQKIDRSMKDISSKISSGSGAGGRN